MAIFGKILAIFNVLAAAAFVYIASMDWAKRHAWAYSVYRHELVIDGLPVDEEVRDPIQGILGIDKLSDSTLQDMFKTVGGNPVRTQRAEVERVHKDLRAQLDALPDDKAKRQRIAAILVPLTRTGGQRDAMRERINSDKVPVAELLADIDAVFAETLALEVRAEDSEAAAAPATQNPRVPQFLPRDKRQAIAHLLFHLNATEEGHARLQVIIGLKAVIAEADRQAEVLNAMVERLKFAMLGDRADFEVEFKGLSDDVRDRADNIDDRALYFEAQKKLDDDHQKLVDGRKKDVEEVKKQLAVARAAINKSLAVQAGEEEVLFKSQRILGHVVNENERLEREIRQLERTKR